MNSIDVAYHLLKKSITLGQKDSDYYMDFVKLHKLLFLGQCYLNFEYGLDLFDDKITANADGPYVHGLNLVPALCGFGEIKNIDDLEMYLNCAIPYHLTHKLPLPLLRDETCDLILENFGNYSTMELVKMSKKTIAYCYSFGVDNNVISRELLTKTGCELAKIIKYQQEENGVSLSKKYKNK